MYLYQNTVSMNIMPNKLDPTEALLHIKFGAAMPLASSILFAFSYKR